MLMRKSISMPRTSIRALGGHTRGRLFRVMSALPAHCKLTTKSSKNNGDAIRKHDDVNENDHRYLRNLSQAEGSQGMFDTVR